MNTLLMLKKTVLRSLTLLVTLVVLLSVVGSAAAQEDTLASKRAVPTAPSQGQGPSDPAELEAFLDDFFARNMEEYHIAGAAIAVVKDGKLFFAKGYGYADIEKGTPVDPERTIFRIGSVGKVLTWTRMSTPISTFVSRIPIHNRSPSST